MSKKIKQVRVESPTMLSGDSWLPADYFWYPPAIKSTDILRVNLDVRDVRADGLYLIEIVEDSRVMWRGCRRFTITPKGLEMDINGKGEWQCIDLKACDTRVVGHVRDVYSRV